MRRSPRIANTWLRRLPPKGTRMDRPLRCGGWMVAGEWAGDGDRTASDDEVLGCGGRSCGMSGGDSVSILSDAGKAAGISVLRRRRADEAHPEAGAVDLGRDGFALF